MSYRLYNTPVPSKPQVIWHFLSKHIGYMFILLSVSFVIGIAGSLNIALVYTILNWGLGVGAGIESVFTRFNNLVIAAIPIADQFISACVFFLILSTLFCASIYAEVVLRSVLIVRIMNATRAAIFKKFSSVSYQYFLDHKQGDLIYRAVEAPTYLTSLYFAITKIVSDVILLSFLLWSMLAIAAPATIFLLVLGALYYAFTQYIGYRRLYSYGQEIKKSRQDYNVILNEFITGVRSIRINEFQESWGKKAAEAVKRNYRYYKKSCLWEGFPDVLLRSLVYFFLGIAAIVIRLKYPENFVAILPVFGAVSFAILNIVPRLSSLGVYRMRILQSLPHVELVYTTLHEDNNKAAQGAKEFDNLEYGIKFEDICFSHQGRQELLKGVSVSFEKGKMTAIVGRSGSGKSTILHLLLRLFAPQNGRIAVDGENLEEYSVSSWLSKIGFVDQDIFIYNTTIKENIIFGLEGCGFNDIIKAAKIANVHDFIMSLPKGYNTVVGDRGVRLSGGEKQRVAIARAVLRNPQIFIFDEATASLDNVSEKLVQQAIDNILEGHTVIVVAHRLSTIQNADKIIVINEGNVAEEGRHYELIEKKGIYWELYNQQEFNKGIEEQTLIKTD